jgi:hypothetical protein
VERASPCRSCQCARLWEHDGPAGPTKRHYAQFHKQCAATASFAASATTCSDTVSAATMGNTSVSCDARSRVRRHSSLRAFPSLMRDLHALRSVVIPYQQHSVYHIITNLHDLRILSHISIPKQATRRRGANLPSVVVSFHFCSIFRTRIVFLVATGENPKAKGSRRL